MQTQHIFPQTLLSQPLDSFKLASLVNSLARPCSESDLKQKSKAVFQQLARIVRESNQLEQLQRAAKVIMALVLVGHFHILHKFDRYLLKELMGLGNSILRMSPIRDREAKLQPNRWRNQFACEMLTLLAEWFPSDFVTGKQDSKYAKIVKTMKLGVKAHFILTCQFVEQVQGFVDEFCEQSDSACQYCIGCYEKRLQRQDLKTRLSYLAPSQITQTPPPIEIPHKCDQSVVEKRLRKKLLKNRDRKQAKSKAAKQASLLGGREGNLYGDGVL